MRKKFSVLYFIFGFIICLSTLFSLSIKGRVFADEIKKDYSSKSMILIDANTGTTLYSKNENERLPIASMCKIMTLLLIYENVDSGNISLDDEVVVSKNASSMGGSQVFLEENGVYKVSELIKSISVASANDSCVAMAEKICGSESDFVAKMNEKCIELGLSNTKFANCTGLPKPEQYSTAHDVAIIFKNLIKHKQYFEVSNIWMEDFSHPQGRVTQMANTNKLVRFYDGCDCGKTGYTSEAGHCLTASAKRNGLRLIAVVIKAPDSKTRFSEVSSMLNYGFSNFESKKIVDDNSNLDIPLKVEGGKKDYILVKPENSIYILSKKGEKRSLEVSFEPISKIKAPILSGETVGKISIYENGLEIDSVNVVSSEDVMQKSYFDVIKDISLNFNVI